MWICPKCQKPVSDNKEKCPHCEQARPFDIEKTEQFGYDGSVNKLFETGFILLAISCFLYSICYFAGESVGGGLFYLFSALIAVAFVVAKIWLPNAVYYAAGIAISLFEFIATINALSSFPGTFDGVICFIFSLIGLLAAIGGLVLFILKKNKYSRYCMLLVGPLFLASHVIVFLNVFVTFFTHYSGTYPGWMMFFTFACQIMFIIFGCLYIGHTLTCYKDFKLFNRVSKVKEDKKPVEASETK